MIEVFAVVHEAWFWTESNRVLRDGGWFITVVHNAASYKAFLRRLLRSGHAEFGYSLSFSETTARLELAGFRLLHANGCCWEPVSRRSNSVLVLLGAAAERLLNLSRIVGHSPWVLVCAQKRAGAIGTQ